nr:hypothetical protein [uncultured Aquabacterium sp.]
MSRKYIQESELRRLRSIDLAGVLDQMCIDYKQDASYEPRRHANSVRWHVTVDAYVYELIITDQHWFDTRAGKGGYGAVDLLMHVLGIGFRDAVHRLQKG